MKRFIQKIHMKKGALHKQLGIPVSKKISPKLLNRISKTKIGNHLVVSGNKIKVTALLKRRALLALKLGKMHK